MKLTYRQRYILQRELLKHLDVTENPSNVAGLGLGTANYHLGWSDEQMTKHICKSFFPVKLTTVTYCREQTFGPLETKDETIRRQLKEILELRAKLAKKGPTAS